MEQLLQSLGMTEGFGVSSEAGSQVSDKHVDLRCVVWTWFYGVLVSRKRFLPPGISGLVLVMVWWVRVAK